MKLVYFLFSFLASNVWAGQGLLPEGNFKGIGDYEIRGKEGGNYLVKTTIDAQGNILSDYNWGDRSTKLVLQFVGTLNAFDVLIDGHEAGKGSCLDLRCDYSARGNGTEVKETLVFVNNMLLRFGTKTEDGTNVTWFEKQKKK